MLTPIEVEEIRRLLAAGKLSQREISKRTGLSRGSITSISMDRRPELRPSVEEPEDDPGPPARCPTCGGLVYMPCRLCRTRDAKYGPSHGGSLRSSPRCRDRRNPPNPSGSLGSRSSSCAPHDRAQRLPGR